MRQFIIVVLLSFLWNFTYSQNITAAEYFFDDNDNGFGSNASLVVSQLNESYSIPLAGLSDGFHDVYFRVFDQAANSGAGAWSHYDRSTFYVADFPTGQDILEARYFIDNGASVGLNINPTGTSVTEAYAISIGSLSEGFHSLYIQTKDTDDTWSHYDRTAFYVADFPTGQNIVAARYFFNDEDPVDLIVDPESPSISESYSISIGSLGEGFHSFYIQTQTTDLTWSLYDRQIIYVKDFNDVPSDVVEAEYFIDEDPGFGLGTNINITANTQMLNVITDNGITDGDHLFCVRVKNANDVWSLYDCAIFNIDSNLDIKDNLFKTTKIHPSPFENKLSIKLSDNTKILKTKIYNNLGQIVYSNLEDKNTLELSHLKSGIYILNIETNQGKASFKIIKK